MTDAEVDRIIEAISEIAAHAGNWQQDYIYNKHTNEFIHSNEGDRKDCIVRNWFNIVNEMD